MAFKLSKADQKQIGEHSARLTALRESVAAEVAKYNAALEEARQFVTGLAGDFQQEIADKSERWQESERGTATQSWVEQLENIELVEIEVEEDDENVTTLDELPWEPDY